jgi:glycosyltransferase involved in cell wall biosynthesis
MQHGVAFNGRFLAARSTGVQRVAEQLITHVDALLDDGAAATTWSLLEPHGTNRKLQLRHIVERQSGRLRGQLWEQLELPYAAQKNILVNLCNQAPLFHKGGVVMIHDVQAFLSPESYSRAFRMWYRFSMPRICAKADIVLTVSNYSREQIIRYGVASADKIKVIYNGVDHVAKIGADKRCLERWGLLPHSYVVALSSTQKHKNIPFLFNVFAHSVPAHLKLVLVGEADRTAFECLGAKPPPNVLFCGKVSDGELRALYENGLCLAFPSTTEGFGLPPLEAMFVGCATVVAPCGALPEVCGDAATYVSPHNVVGWRQAIQTLDNDPAARAYLIEKGRQWAAQFTWNKSAQQLLSIIANMREAGSAKS